MIYIDCPYCNIPAHLKNGSYVYPHRPDLFKKMFYVCFQCKAYVGCHPGTDKPLGRLANAELRKAKQAAHAAFDPMWREKKMKRQNAYAWLADKLNINRNECHIGMMDEQTCRKVVEICSNLTQPSNAPRLERYAK